MRLLSVLLFAAVLLPAQLTGAGPGVAAPRHPLNIRPGRGPRQPQPGRVSLTGLWVGTAQRGAITTPVTLQVTQTGSHIEATFLNGPQHSRAYSGSLNGTTLHLQFPDYANAVTATVEHGVLTGTFAGYAKPELLRLRQVPDIAGNWSIAVRGPKGETAWKLQVEQQGTAVQAVVLRIDGDTGMLYGSFHDGVFTLSHFNADGPNTLTLSLLPDGTLQAGRYIAHRVAATPAAPQPAVDDPLQHTRMEHPDEPLRFRFPDLAGHIVSSTDARFRGKVLLVTVGGSWCPNCHDEAPMLVSLYHRFHARGLEIVDLDFEEAAQLADPTRLRAFIRDYAIPYPVLLAGMPDQLDQKLPGISGLNSWPTLFFIGRDGLVKAIDTGFAGPATGAAHAHLLAETTALVQRLLAGR